MPNYIPVASQHVGVGQVKVGILLVIERDRLQKSTKSQQVV